MLYVVNGLGTGGAERSFAEMAPHLQRRGIRLEVVCLYKRTEGVQALIEGLGISVEFLESETWLGRVLQLRRLIRTRKPDLVHTTITESDIIGRIAAAATGVPVVTSFVNDVYGRVRTSDQRVNKARLELLRRLDGWSARNIGGAFHALTETIADSAVRDLGIDRALVRVIGRGRSRTRLGVADPERRARVRTDLGIGHEDPVLITVGRQEWQKGQETAIRAHALVLERIAGANLLLVGREGNHSGRLRDCARELGIADHVRFLGHRTDSPDLLAASDVFLFPSRYEGFGGALIEAMALGVPSVVSDIPVLREVAGESALFAEVDDPGDFASKAIYLLENGDDRMSLGEDAIGRFEDLYRIEGITDSMVDFYDWAARAGTPRSE
ncbi:MAG TPA: glycosyltransferase [Acidimicrobiia bacterium]